MKKRMKKILSFVLSALTACTFAACGGGKSEHLGLYTAEDGTLMKDGEAFYGVGVNYYSLLNCAFSQKWDVSKSLAALETLAEYDVRVIRFNLAGYTYNDWNYVVKVESKYFETLDKIVSKAEEVGVGLLPCFFWSAHSMADYYDEPISLAWASEYTKTMQFMLDYTEKVVTRYAESPAIYGWEFGNEVNLVSDLPNWQDYLNALPSNSSREERTIKDKLTTTAYASALGFWSKKVKECDPYDRIIGNGDANPRSQAYNLRQNGGWKNDTVQEHEAMLDYLHKDMTAASWHRYYDNGYASRLTVGSLNDGIGMYNTWTGYFSYMLAQGKRMKKGVYLGETGWIYPDATTAVTMEEITLMTSSILNAALETDFPLTLVWNYDDRPVYSADDPTDQSSGTEWSWNENWEKGETILGLIRSANRSFDEKHNTNAGS